MRSPITERPGFIKMSQYINKFFEPHDLLKSDQEILDLYAYAIQGYVTELHVPSKSLLVMALRLCIRINLCKHLCN